MSDILVFYVFIQIWTIECNKSTRDYKCHMKLLNNISLPVLNVIYNQELV